MGKRSIIHIDFASSAPKKSGEFFKSAFDWDIVTDEQFDYTMFTSGNIGGGFPQVGEERKTGEIVVYIDSADIEADLKTIEAHGGKRIGDKVEVPGMGWFAHFSDPTGAHLALWQSANPQA